MQGRAVTSMAWNTLNSDLLAVGYGKIDTFVDSNKLGEANIFDLCRSGHHGDLGPRNRTLKRSRKR